MTRGRTRKRRRRRQTGGFLSRYHFAYTGRDSINQAACQVKKIVPGMINHAIYKVGEQTRSVAPRLINQTSKKLDRIAQRRIRQVVREGGQEIERIVPKIIRGGIEDFYKTPFKLLGRIGRRKLAQLKSKFVKRSRNRR